MNICVFGAARDEIAPAYLKLGEELGEALAERGHTMVFGAGAHGMMGAAARGAHRRGGRIIGVAPYFFDRPGILFQDCTELLQMDTMAQRKIRMRERSEAFIALPGGIGTMEELFEVITLRSLGQMDKPIVLLEAEDFWAPAVAMLESAVEKGFAQSSLLEQFRRFDRVEDCLDYLEGEARHDL